MHSQNEQGGVHFPEPKGVPNGNRRRNRDSANQVRPVKSQQLLAIEDVGNLSNLKFSVMEGDADAKKGGDDYEDAGRDGDDGVLDLNVHADQTCGEEGFHLEGFPSLVASVVVIAPCLVHDDANAFRTGLLDWLNHFILARRRLHFSLPPKTAKSSRTVNLHPKNHALW
jgi:hypothetical protein